MKSVLVVDQNKISILMTVEACKDVITKARVQVAYTGEDALKKIAEEEFDLIIVDFDLPDCDGVSFIKEMKKTLNIPMFLTAFPDPVVMGAIQKELYWYKDASRLISKPVDFRKLRDCIEDLVLQEGELMRTFQPKAKAILTPCQKTKIKTKKELSSQVLDMTINGVSLKCSQAIPYIKNEKVSLQFCPEQKGKTNSAFLVRATVFFVNSRKKELELTFEKLSAQVQKKLEDLLKKSKALD